MSEDFMGLSAWHIILLTIIVLIFFGPSRLPGLGKSIGSAIRGFKEGLDGAAGGEKKEDPNQITEGKPSNDSSEDKKS